MNSHLFKIKNHSSAIELTVSNTVVIHEFLQNFKLKHEERHKNGHDILGNNTLYKKNYHIYALWEEKFDKLISLSFLSPSVHCSCFLLSEAPSSGISRSNLLAFLGNLVAIGFDFKDIRPNYGRDQNSWATQWTFRVWVLLCYCWGSEALIYNLIHLFVLCFWYMRSSKVWTSYVQV